MDWTTRINQAIDYIEENLEDDIDLKYAAQLACCSLNNFTNMFLVTTGIQVSENGQLIGGGFLYHLPEKPNFPDSPEVGWEIHRDYWRQGYGTEIGKTLLRLGFDIMGLRRITTCCNAKNVGSYRIMEKIGMRREAHFIKAQRGNSALNYEWCDRFQYAILREEWSRTNS